MKNKRVPYVIVSVLVLIIAINAYLDDSLMVVRIDKNLTRIDYDNPLKEIALNLLTGFRQIFARVIWEKIHQYFHRYEFFERSGMLTFNAKDPTKSNYKQTDIMPWIRIATWLDPTFYEPYLVGAWHLANNLNLPDEAQKLLDEVEAKNPDDPVLKYELANNYITMHNYEKALKYAQLALKSGKLGLFETIDSYRIMKLAYKNLGDTQKEQEMDKVIKSIVRENREELERILEEQGIETH